MQLTPYKDLIGLTEEERLAKSAVGKTRTQKKKGEFAIARLDEEILKLEESVTSLCSKPELDFDAIINKLDELALSERKKKQFEDVISQLFPADDVKA